MIVEPDTLAHDRFWDMGIWCGSQTCTILNSSYGCGSNFVSLRLAAGMLEYSKCCLRCVLHCAALRCTALHAPDENMRHHRSWFSSIGVRIQEQETLQASYHLSQSGCKLVDDMLSILNRTELVRYRTYKIGGFALHFSDQLTITGVRKGVHVHNLHDSCADHHCCWNLSQIHLHDTLFEMWRQAIPCFLSSM